MYTFVTCAANNAHFSPQIGEASLVWSNKKVFSNVIMDDDDLKVLDGQKPVISDMMVLNKRLQGKKAFFFPEIANLLASNIVGKVAGCWPDFHPDL